MQFKHTLIFTLTLIDARSVLIEYDGVLKLHIHQIQYQINSLGLKI